MGKAEIDAWAKKIIPHSTGKKVVKRGPKNIFVYQLETTSYGFPNFRYSRNSKIVFF